MTLRSLVLDEGWQLARATPGSVSSLDALAGAPLQWQPAVVPGTVAASLQPGDVARAGAYDADDWWYRTTFAAPAAAAGARWRLRFDGLATLAEVWLNGKRILDARSMFARHAVDVTALVRDVNQLAIRFASLDVALGAKRPRPKWKTALVEQQNLRWFRTTLFGRMPAWSPPIEPVGPYAPIVLECVEAVDLKALSLQASAPEREPRLSVRATVATLDGAPLEGARILVGGEEHRLRWMQGEEARLMGELLLPDMPLWWPHTHGEPALVPWKLEVQVHGDWHTLDAGRIGFRDVALDGTGGQVRFLVNGVPVFCRGACWTPADPIRIHADAQELRKTLALVQASGANMLRIGGTMAYESDAFYALCDELGILVWQDFMFANMDYPVRDAAFRATVEAEAREVLARLQRHACVAAYCGGSEVAQQAAMMGLAREHWTNEFFAEALPALCAESHPGVPYFPSSPWGGDLPFHVGTGIAHYYGVGAYRRPIADVKGAKVKFAAECLGFSNVPEDRNLARLVPGGDIPPPHHPAWKARVPRDMGSGYDFEDVRDHYVHELYGLDVARLRAQDPERYRALGRVATGEVMRQVYAQWRSPGDACGGALVWFLRDLWPGAGWGVIDSDGAPKPAWWALRRAWSPLALTVTDEGMDGLAVHVVNDTPQMIDATLEVEMLRDGRRAIARTRAPLLVPAHSAATRTVDGLFGYFTDCSNAYRFGPPKFDAVIVRLRRNGDDAVLREDVHFPAGMDLPTRHADVRHVVEAGEDGSFVVRIASDALLQSVRIDCDGYFPDDNYFHLAPHQERRIVFSPRNPVPGPFRASFEALNLAEAVVVRGDAANDSSEALAHQGGTPRDAR